MSKRDDIILLEDIVDSIKKINGYTTHANLPADKGRSRVRIQKEYKKQ